MGLNLYKEVTMNLQLINQNHGFEENNSSVTNAQRPLARGRDCDIFCTSSAGASPRATRATARIL